MTFQPIMPMWMLITLAAILFAVRMVALFRLLVRTGPGRYRTVVLRWTGLTLAVLALVMAAARPGVSAREKSEAEPSAPVLAAANINVFFVVDRSVDERVEDFGDRSSRMSGIRTDITALIDHYKRARYAIIDFSSKAAVQWPISADVWSLKPVIGGLSPYTDVPPEAMYQVDAGAAHDVLRGKLAEAAEDFPDSKSLVFYFGSGAGGSRAEQSRFELGDVKIDGGAVFGYGTPAGGQIPKEFTNNGLVFMTDPQTGQPLVSQLNEDALRGVAGQLGVPYFHRDKGQPVEPAIPAVDPGKPADENPVLTRRLIERDELYWVFTGIAAAFVLAEIYLTVRDVRRSRVVRRDVVL